MQQRTYVRRAEYLNDLRREPRWIDGRMALSRVGDLEFPGMTGDISLSGLRLALVGLPFVPEDDIVVDVAYEEELVSLTGRIRYALSKPWGCVVGVRLHEIAPETRDFLEHRYKAPAGTA